MTSCYGDDHDRRTLVIVRTTVAGICAVVCMVQLIVMCIFMKWRRFMHRILLYFTVATIVYLLVFVAQAIAGSSHEENLMDGCKAAGFFNQLTSWLHLEFTLWMAAYILYLSCHDIFNPNDKTDPRDPPLLMEVIILAVISVVALVMSFIPVPYAYGLVGGWCWIWQRKMDSDGNCEEYIPGKVEQWVLWWVWLLLAAVVMAGLLVIASFLLYKMSQKYKFESEFFKKRSRQMMIILFLYLGVFFVFTVVEVSLRIANSVRSRFSLGEWLTVAIISPIGAVFLPVMFFVYLWCVGRFGRKEEDQPPLEKTPIVAPLI